MIGGGWMSYCEVFVEIKVVMFIVGIGEFFLEKYWKNILMSCWDSRCDLKSLVIVLNRWA